LLVDFCAAAVVFGGVEEFRFQTESFDETLAVCASIRDPDKEVVTNVETLVARVLCVPSFSSTFFMIAMHADLFR
jgi:hypothetical protein